MPRPPNPLTPDELLTLQKYVRYDAKQDILVWNPRDPADFGTKDPARTANGFNRAKAGSRVGLNANKSFAITILGKVRRYTENKARAALGAPHAPIPEYATKMVRPRSRTVRHPHARGKAAMNTNPDGNVHDRGLIRTLFYMDARRVLRWRKLSREDFERVRPEIASRSVAAGFMDVKIPDRALKAYNASRADKVVQVTTAGVVRAFAVLKVSPYVLMEVFPGCAEVEVTKPRPAPPGLPDNVLLKFVDLDPRKGVVWRARGVREWQTAVLFGICARIPDAEGIEAWNAMNAGERVPSIEPPNRTMVYRIGKRSVGVQRLNTLVLGVSRAVDP